jgi:hypothetical protein
VGRPSKLMFGELFERTQPNSRALTLPSPVPRNTHSVAESEVRHDLYLPGIGIEQHGVSGKCAETGFTSASRTKRPGWLLVGWHPMAAGTKTKKAAVESRRGGRHREILTTKLGA